MSVDLDCLSVDENTIFIQVINGNHFECASSFCVDNEDSSNQPTNIMSFKFQPESEENYFHSDVVLAPFDSKEPNKKQFSQS
jgi:hypothetical protein